jgi:hypothetical protein
VVWLDRLVDLFVLGVDVGGNDREGKVLEKLAQLLVTSIKLVVSKRHGREVELVERLGNLLAAVERVEQGALKFVANIQPEAVVVFGALLFNHGLDAGISAVASL